MERREAERAAKTWIPTAFSLLNVGKSFANFQRGSARGGLVAAPLGPLYTLVGGGGGVSSRGRARPFTVLDKTRKGPRTSISPPSPFPATAETKKCQKKQQNGCQTSQKRKNEAKGKVAPALCAFTVFCVLLKAECSNEGG